MVNVNDECLLFYFLFSKLAFNSKFYVDSSSPLTLIAFNYVW